MSQGKHTAFTPGPWRAECDLPGGILPMAMVATGAKGKKIRAIDVTDSGRDYLESCANARLIAAAPDLLEALKPFADLGVGLGPDDEVDAAPYRILRGAIRNARAAISKATGER